MRKRTVQWGASIAVAAGLMFGACGDDDDTDEGADDTTSEETDDGGSESAGDGLTIVDFSFSPDDVVVAPGAEVTVTNEDGAPHTYTAEDGSFDSGSLSAGGGVGMITAPDEAGTYDVFCSIHPDITGTLTVEG